MVGPGPKRLLVGLGAVAPNNGDGAPAAGAAAAVLEAAGVPPKSPIPGGFAAGVVEPAGGAPNKDPAGLGSAGLLNRPPA